MGRRDPGPLEGPKGRDALERIARLESDLLHARGELVRLMRVAAVGELVPAIAEELWSPISAVLHDAEAARRFLARAPPDLERARVALDAVVGEIHRAGAIVEELRRVTGRAGGDRGPVRIERLLAEVVRPFRPEAAARGVSMAIESACDLPPVMADPRELRTAFAHLVASALENAAVGEPSSPEVRVRAWLTPDGQIAIEVGDTGPSFAPEAVPHVFDPLFTCGCRARGAVLALCRHICEAEGGSIAAASGIDRSTLLAIMLPAAERPSQLRGEPAP